MILVYGMNRILLQERMILAPRDVVPLVRVLSRVVLLGSIAAKIALDPISLKLMALLLFFFLDPCEY
jgi:hypothetical protein